MVTFPPPAIDPKLLCNNGDSSTQLATEKQTLHLFGLPLEIFKQIVSEVVADGPILFSTGKWRPMLESRTNIMSLLLTNKRLGQEVSEQMYNLLHIYISGDDINTETDTWESQDLLAYWEHTLQTVPWKSFREIKICLIPSLYRHGTRIWNLTNLFEITQMVAPKLQVELGDEVRQGRSKVQLVCCEIDGKHASHHNHVAGAEELPLPCWTFFQLGLVLETWKWIQEGYGSLCSPGIHLPNVILPLHLMERKPRVFEFWTRWLSKVKETAPVPPSPASIQTITQMEFTSRHRRKYWLSLVVGTSDDQWILVRGLEAKGSNSNPSEFTYTSDQQIENQMGPYRVRADNLLREIGHQIVDLPASTTPLSTSYTQLAEDLRTKAHPPGMPEITKRLEAYLREVETLRESARPHVPL